VLDAMLGFSTAPQPLRTSQPDRLAGAVAERHATHRRGRRLSGAAGDSPHANVEVACLVADGSDQHAIASRLLDRAEDSRVRNVENIRRKLSALRRIAALVYRAPRCESACSYVTSGTKIWPGFVRTRQVLT